MTRTAGAVAVALLLLAGCSGGEEEGPAADAAATTTGTARMPTRGSARTLHIVVVTHGAAADPFWAVVENGIDAAARDLDVDISYRAPDVYDVAVMRRLVEAAVAARPDGLVVTLPDARALAPALRKAARAKIPVVAMNSGADTFRRVGALAFVGQREYEAGLAAGRRMAVEGVRTAICVVHQAGVENLEQRCRGFGDALARRGGRSIVVETGIQQQQEAVGRLSNWVSGSVAPIDGVLTLGPAGATPALTAMRAEDAFGKVKLATFDLAPDIVDALRAGEIEFAIDQQPYLQGYLPIVFLAQRARYGLMPAEGTLIPTGPHFVTAKEAARLNRLTGEGIR